MTGPPLRVRASRRHAVPRRAPGRRRGLGSVRPMAGRGGQQQIPRPPGARPGRPAPWVGHAAEARRLDLATVRSRLAAPPVARSAGHRRSRCASRSGARSRSTRSTGTRTWSSPSGPRPCRRTRARSPFRAASVTRAIATLLAAALREAHEEVGIEPHDGRARRRARRHRHGRVGVHHHARSSVCSVRSRSCGRTRSRWSSAFAVPISELLHPETYREEIWDIFGRLRPMAFFELPGETVWGATARILTGVLSRLTGTESPGQVL